MNLDLLLKLLGVAQMALPILGGAIHLITHMVGSDTHKTVAGDIADKLTQAGHDAGELRKDLLNGVQHGDPQADPPT